MTEILITGLLTASAILIVMAKIDIRKFLGLEVPIDVAVTVGLATLGAMTGTFSGLMMGVLSGLIFSIVFWFLRKVFGYKVLTRHGWETRESAWRQTVRAKVDEARQEHKTEIG
jgi:hypothetical protein